jgi:hypothetical protein
LQSGTYKVTAGVYDLTLLGETPGYITTTVSGVSVTAGQETPNQDYNLQPSAWISGNITASSGKPIFRALVTANSTTGGFSGYEYTDDTGFYRITTGLNASTYTVTAKYQGASQSKTGVAATAGAETTNTNIQLAVPAGGEVIGRVTDASSKLGIGQAVVQITGSTSAQVKTDPKGYYSYFVGAGSYVISTVVPGFVTNKTTTQVTNNQVARVYYPVAASSGFAVSPLSGANSGKISGNVTGQTSPIPEFPVAIVPATFSIAILLILLANRRLKRNNNKA